MSPKQQIGFRPQDFQRQIPKPTPAQSPADPWSREQVARLSGDLIAVKNLTAMPDATPK